MFLNTTYDCLLFLVLGLATFTFVTAIIPWVIRGAFSMGILDQPAQRKVHTLPTPRLGGLAIAPGLWVGCTVALVILWSFPGMRSVESFYRLAPGITGLLIGGTGALFVGILDDLRPLQAGKKLMGLALVSLIALQFMPLPEQIMGLAIHPTLMFALAFSWLVVIPNAVNLLDGIDGLTSTLFSLFSVFLVLTSLISGHWLIALCLTPLLCASLAFLRFNWSPAKIFLGDSGSLMLGFCVAYLSLFAAIVPSTSSSGYSWNIFISLALTSIWVLDCLYAIIRRYRAKVPHVKIFVRRSSGTYLGLQQEALKNIFRPDRGHLHHRLLSRGFSASKASLLLGGFWLVAALFIVPFMFGTPGSNLTPAEIIAVGMGVSLCVLCAVQVSRQPRQSAVGPTDISLSDANQPSRKTRMAA
jgi:UDP-GlcNAc:undecaprenyl-phosphate GlcNAc-1-phosphate transferase